jgi:FkbM family methyltransferase
MARRSPTRPLHRLQPASMMRPPSQMAAAPPRLQSSRLSRPKSKPLGAVSGSSGFRALAYWAQATENTPGEQVSPCDFPQACCIRRLWLVVGLAGCNAQPCVAVSKYLCGTGWLLLVMPVSVLLSANIMTCEGVIMPDRDVSYSNPMTREDRWVIDEILEGRKTPGFFVEAGASDGIIGSNTYLLETRCGWTDLCWETNQQFFERLKANRSCHVRHCALSDQDGEIEFIEAGWFGAAPEHVQHVFDKKDADLPAHDNYQKDFDGGPAKRVRVPARALRSLLNEIDAPPVIDYLSLDVEGSELFALKGFPSDRYRVLCASIEAHWRELVHCTMQIIACRSEILWKPTDTDCPGSMTPTIMSSAARRPLQQPNYYC